MVASRVLAAAAVLLIGGLALVPADQGRPLRGKAALFTNARFARSAGTPSPRRLTLAQLAGQRVVAAYLGDQPPAGLLRTIRAGLVGGVIFYGGNIASRRQIRSVIRRLQRASLASPLHDHLLILTDQEGGDVRRLPGAPVPSEKQIGESSLPVAAAARAGAAAGRNLAGVGINVNLAPVLDVFRQPGDFIDEYGRSYSGHPGQVGRLGAAFISHQQRTGVAATAKAFPGLGLATTDENTDLRPVTLRLSRRALRDTDEAPYRSAIRSGVKLIMTSWAIYPALDPGRPAGFSARIIGRELGWASAA